MRQTLAEALIDSEGALVAMSYDRHPIRSTIDDPHLVHDDRIELFDGNPEDCQQWPSDS